MIVLHFLEHESHTERDKSILSHKRLISCLILNLFISEKEYLEYFQTE